MILDRADIQSRGLKRRHGGFATGAGALDANFDLPHAHPPGFGGHPLRRPRGGKRRGLPRTLESHRPGGIPTERLTVDIGDGDDGVIERRVDVRDALDDVFSDFLLGHETNAFSLNAAPSSVRADRSLTILTRY